jgi:hypothetical protein
MHPPPFYVGVYMYINAGLFHRRKVTSSSVLHSFVVQKKYTYSATMMALLERLNGHTTAVPMALTIKRVHAPHGEQESQVAPAVPGSDDLLGDSGQVPKDNSREDATLCEDGKHNREEAPESRNDEGFSSAQDDRAGTDEKQVTVAGKVFSNPALSHAS